MADDYPNLFVTEFTGNVLLSGGTPKMEGSIVVLILNIVLILGFAFLLKKRQRYSHLLGDSTASRGREGG